ncbi:hypothetical protein FB451DRAFT_1371125 [Mycena latifolia]|nr:hypothetical protein FB451DRAFT_1371125 [Mycena latifolia]
MRAVIHRYALRVHYLEFDMTERDIRQLELDSAVFPVLQSAKLGYHQGRSPTHIPLRSSAMPPASMTSTCYSVATSHLPIFPSLVPAKKIRGRDKQYGPFTLAPNLAEVTCYFEDIPPPAFMIAHLRLGSITLVESWAEVSPDDIFQCITLPSLCLKSGAYCLRVTGTISKLFDTIYAIHRSNRFGFRVCRVAGNTWILSISYTEDPANCDLFGYSGIRVAFLDMEVLAEPGVTRRYEPIASHLARIANAGMDIYIGIAYINYAQIDRTATATE